MKDDKFKSVRDTVLVLLIVLAMAIGAKLYYVAIENIAISQNTINLNNTSKCAKKIMHNHGENKEIFLLAMNICARDTRSIGQTGDMFVIRQSDAKIIWDASKDCSIEDSDDAYLTKDGVCALFAEPDTCVKAANIMISKPPKGTLRWMFDDSEEMVNYLYLDKKIDGEQYIFGSGTQTDELTDKTKVFIIPMIGMMLLILVVLSM